MPELPDVNVYVEALAKRVVGHRVEGVSIRSPFVLRTFEPATDAAEGRMVQGVERVGKRIVLALERHLFLVIHLMIAGRLRWFEVGKAVSVGKIELLRITFDTGTLVLTEAGTKKRASLHVVEGREALKAIDPGGLEVIGVSRAEFGAALIQTNRTLKRALTDPRTFSGIGNAYSDEILHAAGLSPVKLTRAMKEDEITRLHGSVQRVLAEWTERLRGEFGLDKGLGRFPGAGEITAFRSDFAVHGRFGMACPVCGGKVQRIIRAENECNYCPKCQTGGKVLADRSLSRLFKEDWGKEMGSE